MNSLRTKKKKVRRKKYKKESKVVKKTQPTPKKNPRQVPDKGVQAQPVKFKTGPRENKFESSPIFNDYKQDISIDKKLWGNNKSYERDRKNEKVVVACTSCHRDCEVLPNLVFKMPNGEYSFTCDKCVRRG